MEGRAWYNPQGCKELDMTELLHFHFQKLEKERKGN